MRAGPRLLCEDAQIALVAQCLLDDPRLTFEEQVRLSITNENGALHTVDDVLECELGKPVIYLRRRLRAERPQRMFQGPLGTMTWSVSSCLTEQRT